jgi:hypothetical protein
MITRVKKKENNGMAFRSNLKGFISFPVEINFTIFFLEEENSVKVWLNEQHETRILRKKTNFASHPRLQTYCFRSSTGSNPIIEILP